MSFQSSQRWCYVLISSFMFLSASCSKDGNSIIKIVNGVVTNQDSLVITHTVAIIDPSDQKAYCTGTVIDRKWILTAAHCFEDSADMISVSFGLGYREESDVIIINGTPHLHPEFDDIEDPTTHYGENDIALIKLETNTPDFVKPVSLAYEEDVAVGSEVILAGYGINELEMHLANLKTESLVIRESLREQLPAEDQDRLNHLSAEKNDLYLAKNRLVKDWAEASDDEDHRRIQQEISQMNLVIKEKEEAFELLDIELISSLEDSQFSEMKERIAEQELKVETEGRSGKILREVTTTIDTITDDNVIIYKSENGLNSGCFGDSGGPMYLLNDTDLIQVGVTQGPYLKSDDSVERCQGSGVYTNVARYRDFIADLIEN